MRDRFWEEKPSDDDSIDTEANYNPAPVESSDPVFQIQLARLQGTDQETIDQMIEDLSDEDRERWNNIPTKRRQNQERREAKRAKDAKWRVHDEEVLDAFWLINASTDEGGAKKADGTYDEDRANEILNKLPEDKQDRLRGMFEPTEDGDDEDDDED